MAEYKLVIEGKMPNLNDYTKANRASFRAGNEMKRDHQYHVELLAKTQLRGVKLERPVEMFFTFYEQNKKRDQDNVAAFARKVVQDALTKVGVLPNDGWKNICGYHEHFEVDKNSPRIEVVLREVGECPTE